MCFRKLSGNFRFMPSSIMLYFQPNFMEEKIWSFSLYLSTIVSINHCIKQILNTCINHIIIPSVIEDQRCRYYTLIYFDKSTTLPVIERQIILYAYI